MTLRSIGLCLCALMLTGCSVIQSQDNARPISLDSRIAVIPLSNLSQTPQAGDQAASILSVLLRAEGATDVRLYLPEDQDPLAYDNRVRQQEAQTRAMQNGADLIVSGTVDEWQYKKGLDGEPAIGITLEVRDPSDDRVVWSGTGARTGWGREGLSVAGHKVLQSLLNAMPFTAGSPD